MSKKNRPGKRLTSRSWVSKEEIAAIDYYLDKKSSCCRRERGKEGGKEGEKKGGKGGEKVGEINNERLKTLTCANRVHRGKSLLASWTRRSLEIKKTHAAKLSLKKSPGCHVACHSGSSNGITRASSSE